MSARRTPETEGRERRTLILAVDRDDDLGRKAGLAGPVVGRQAVVDAATRLAVADPEDSDVNGLFAAVKVLDEARENAAPGAVHEVAVVTGSDPVGPASDRRVVAQVEALLAEFRPDRLVVVTDGAEDEHILPLLESRVPIDAVHRVVVKQARDLEGAYYLLVRLFEDERMRKRYILPAGLALIVFGIALAVNQIILAIALALVTLGLFLFVHAMGWEAGLARMARDFAASLKTGRVAFFTSVFAVAFIALGLLTAYTDLHRSPDLADPLIAAAQTDLLLFALLFVAFANWWVLGGLTLNVVGRLADDLIHRAGGRGMYWRLLFALPALAFLLAGLTRAAVAWRTDRPLAEIAGQAGVLVPLLVGLGLALIGNLLHRFAGAGPGADPDDGEATPGVARTTGRARREGEG